jgi:hypothetical protein
MSSKKCLNCEADLQAKYCSQCGQKADTHRITLKHFIMHDLLHGVFHIDKGILFTIKQTFSRPGKSANDYIGGKRINYYNIFYLTLIVLGLNVLLVHYAVAWHGVAHQPAASEDGVKLLAFFSKNIKYIILSFIPLFALNSLLIFRRKQYNIAEQHIVSGFALLGCTIIAILVNLLSFLAVNNWANEVIEIAKSIIKSSMFFYVAYVYYSAFGSLYSKAGFSWRMLLMFIMFFIEALIILLGIVIVVFGGHFEGTLNLT